MIRSCQTDNQWEGPSPSQTSSNMSGALGRIQCAKGHTPDSGTSVASLLLGHPGHLLVNGACLRQLCPSCCTLRHAIRQECEGCAKDVTSRSLGLLKPDCGGGGGPIQPTLYKFRGVTRERLGWDGFQLAPKAGSHGLCGLTLLATGPWPQLPGVTAVQSRLLTTPDPH